MNYSFLVNKKIVNKANQSGVIISVSDYIYVIHEREKNPNAKYQLSAIDKKDLVFVFEEDLEQYKKEKQKSEYYNTIKSFLQERGISELVHFTNIKNIDSIKKYGLLSINKMNEMGIKYYANDKSRYDGYRDAICLSISRVNEPLFVQYCSKSNDEFVTLYIDASMLYIENNKRIYCQTNAANSDKSIVKGNSISELKAMFNDNVTYNVNSSYESRTISRVEKKRKGNETTDIQAEILWFDNVPLKYIKFPESKDKNNGEEEDFFSF